MSINLLGFFPLYLILALWKNRETLERRKQALSRGFNYLSLLFSRAHIIYWAFGCWFRHKGKYPQILQVWILITHRFNLFFGGIVWLNSFLNTVWAIEISRLFKIRLMLVPFHFLRIFIIPLSLQFVSPLLFVLIIIPICIIFLVVLFYRLLTLD